MSASLQGTGGRRLFKGMADLRKGWQVGRSEGFGPIIRTVVVRLRAKWNDWQARRYDARHGIDTSGFIRLEELTVDGGSIQTGHLFMSSPIGAMRRRLAKLRSDYRDFTFIDFGSGKGAVLFVAAEFNFNKIVGVEFARELHEATLRNFETFHNPAQKCHDLTSVCIDAAEYKIPETPLVLYFGDPFEPTVLNKVLENVQESYRHTPRKIYFIYVGPYFDCFTSLSFARCILNIPSSRAIWLPAPYALVIYETTE